MGNMDFEMLAVLNEVALLLNTIATIATINLLVDVTFNQ